MNTLEDFYFRVYTYVYIQKPRNETWLSNLTRFRKVHIGLDPIRSGQPAGLWHIAVGINMLRLTRGWHRAVVTAPRNRRGKCMRDTEYPVNYTECFQFSRQRTDA